MTQIGTFTRTIDGYTGTIRTLTLKRDVIVIVPAIANEADNAPNYRVLADDVEVGAGWKRTGDKAWRLRLAVDRRSIVRSSDPRKPVPGGERRRHVPSDLDPSLPPRAPRVNRWRPPSNHSVSP